MTQLAATYTEAATQLFAIADQLDKTPDDPDSITAALRNTLALLEHLCGLEPNPQIRAGLHRLGTELSTAGHVASAKIREIGDAVVKIAQNYARDAAQWNNLWS